MNDFSYPSMSKDMSKVGGILYPETSTFSRPNPINKSNSFSQPQEYDQWRSNSLPTSVSMTLPTNTNMNASINNTNNTNMNNSSNSNPAINPVSCDLQDVIIYYQSQPELLRLILLSKVEEDKRRAEEAKLRAKELDMFLLQQQQQMTNGTPQTPDASIMSSTPPSIITNHSGNNMLNNCTTTTSTPITTTNTATNNLLNANQFGQIPRRPSALEMLMDDSDCNRRDSALGSSFDGSANSDELDDRTFSPNSTSSAAAATSMLSMSFTAEPIMSARNSLHPLSPPYTLNNNNQQIDDTLSSQIKPNTSPVEPPRRYDPYFPQRPRRRREMQAISKIVETRDYPYVDGFFWKNNGNTIQKKTGNKSVYYKCSNSSKGCPVNKTVTWKENGEYLIKYRGEHLAECGKVQRIVDM